MNRTAPKPRVAACLIASLLGLAAWTLPAAPTGPRLDLDLRSGEPVENGLAQFMYFVPLISPDPVYVDMDSGNTQRARILSSTCRTNGTTVRAKCEFQFLGQGKQQNLIDPTRAIKNHGKDLKSGKALTRQLAAITIQGAGHGRIEIEGTISNASLSVNEVQMQFTGRGDASPVSITLRDIRYADGGIHFENEIVARVNTLAFHRQPGAPKMIVTLASVKRKDADDGLWQNFVGGLKGVAANLFIPPIAITAEGQKTMLNFGLALATNSPAFTFPLASRLETTAPPILKPSVTNSEGQE